MCFWAEGLRHVSEGSINSALSGDGVRTGGEEFCDTRDVES